MASFPEQVDVLIVGYGPVGAAMAALLGQYGVRTLVVDRSPDILLMPRAIALDNEALRILQMAGLADDAFARIPIPCVRMHCPVVGEFACVDTAGTIDGHPALVTFYQPDLERALRAQVGRHGCVTSQTGVEMVELRDEGEGVSAVLRACGSDQTATVCARYLVGADGASSRVRQAIGEDFRGKTYAEDWLIVDALDVPGAFDHVEFLCDPERPTPHMVAPGGRTRWEFMLRPGETREQMEDDATVAELLAPWARAGDLRIERRAVYRFHARSCARYRKGRVFLAGDAAHVTPPFVGQGLVAGLRDAANLSWKLAWVVHGRAAPSILDSYDQERRPHAAKMIALAKLMGQLIMPRRRARALIVHGAIALLRRFAFFRRQFDELGVKPQNAFRKGLFAPGRGHIRRGAWLPQRLVRAPSGAVMRSDDVLGPSLVLVGAGADPASYLAEETGRAWAAAGGRTFELGALTADGWCVVVRPDRTVLHDGPVTEADRIAREALQVLGKPVGGRV